MKEFKNVIGSQKTVPMIEIGKTTVYVRTNIEPYTEIHSEESVFVGWKYDEMQYDINEYLALCGEKIFTLEATVAQLEGQIKELNEARG
ncbi:hypothetical protein HYI36_22835 [Bacillus sp. Gen3]|nr:hypothetical protein [Bacillus sp. Gen3]